MQIGAAVHAFEQCRVLCGQPIAGLVASGEKDIAYAATYLRIVGFSLFGYGVLVTGNAAMNARSKALWSMGMSLGRIFALYLPLAWALVGLLGFTGIAIAAATANVVTAAVMIFATARTGLSPLNIDTDPDGAEPVAAE